MFYLFMYTFLLFKWVVWVVRMRFVVCVTPNTFPTSALRIYLKLALVALYMTKASQNFGIIHASVFVHVSCGCRCVEP